MSTSDKLKRYNEFRQKTLWYAHNGENNAPEAAYLALGLTGESGEFGDAIKKIVRKTGFDNFNAFNDQLEINFFKLVAELGDVFWYLTGLCDYLDITLEELASYNAQKLWCRCVDAGLIDAQEIPQPFPGLEMGGEIIDWEHFIK